MLDSHKHQLFIKIKIASLKGSIEPSVIVPILASFEEVICSESLLNIGSVSSINTPKIASNSW